MKAVIQRVTSCTVSVNNQTVGAIGNGLVVLLGMAHHDTAAEVEWMVKKIINLRIFSDENGKMNLSVKDSGGELLVVSQFTLYSECEKGNRPSFGKAAEPEKANSLYELFVAKCKETGLKTQTGTFGAMMDVALVNNGPVTIILEKNSQ